MTVHKKILVQLDFDVSALIDSRLCPLLLCPTAITALNYFVTTTQIQSIAEEYAMQVVNCQLVQSQTLPLASKEADTERLFATRKILEVATAPRSGI
jgi:hypothetical protein